MLISKAKLKYAISVVLDQLQELGYEAKWINPPLGSEIHIKGYKVQILTDKQFKDPDYKINFGTDGSIDVIFVKTKNPNFEKYMDSFDEDAKQLYIQILKHAKVNISDPKSVSSYSLGVLPKRYRNYDYLKQWSDTKFGSNWNKSK